MTTAYRHAIEMPKSMRAASLVAPMVLQATGPLHSVVDLGGGNGGWLKAFQENGVEKIRLYDCPQAATALVIDPACFEPIDFNARLPAISRHDLAMCLECAEHLHPAQSQPLVDWLTSCADRVLFSAAVPDQEGTGHINLQTPDYWRDLFQSRGFVRRDVLRLKMLANPAIPWWYRQNLYLFTKPEIGLHVREDEVFPDEFLLLHRTTSVNLWKPGLRFLLRRLGPAFLKAVRDRLPH